MKSNLHFLQAEFALQAGFHFAAIRNNNEDDSSTRAEESADALARRV